MNPKVLVVDDHPVIFQALQAMVQEIAPDYEVIAAESLARARHIYRNSLNILLIILDLRLPDSRHTEGVTILSQEFPNCPLVVFSADDQESVRKACLRSGAKAFLSKGCKREEVFDLLREFLNVKTPSLETQQNPQDLGLSVRQLEIMRLLIDGLTAREIAGHLKVFESTIKSHIKLIYARTGCHNRVELVHWCAKFMPPVSQPLQVNRS